MEAYLTKNIGETHIKWSPCEAVFYNLRRTFHIKDKSLSKLVQKCCHKKNAELYDELELCDNCMKNLNGYEEDGVDITRAENEYIFSIESLNQENPIDILLQSIDVLEQKAIKVKENIM